jgi:flagellar L-ring protein FlgH
MRALAPLLAAACASACASLPPQAPASPASLAAATTNAAKQAAGAVARANAGPQLSPHTVAAAGMDMPAAMTDDQSRGANALWQAGARNFFNDQRARRIGDILTVRIDISDRANVSNESNRRRQSNTTVGVPNLFGLERTAQRAAGGAFDPATLIEAEGTTRSQGQGSIAREDRVTLTVAAVVTDILPNGNFVISGRQEVKVNAELRELTVAGVIRPEDVAADNTIRHTQIAEARINYGGRGQITAVQRPGWAQRVADAVSPW